MTEPVVSEQKAEPKNNETSTRNSVPSLTTRQNIIVNNDMKYFKNELLKELKKIKQELFAKFSEYSLEINEKVRRASTDNEQLEEKIEFISKNIDTKITSFLNEKNKYNLDRIIADIRDNIMTNDIKIQTMREELRVHKDQYEDIVRNNILYQGMIGPGCKYRNQHQFIDFLLASLNNLTTQLNQKTTDMRSYKTKTDNNFHNINSQINEIIMGYKSYVNQSMKDFDEKIRNEIKTFDDKILELRVQNMQNAKDVQRKLSDYDEKYKTLDNLENTINENNGKVIDDIKESNNKLFQMMEDYKKEIEELKKQYNELLEFNNEIKNKLGNLNIFKKNFFDAKNSQKRISRIDQRLIKNELSNSQSQEFDIKNKKFKNQSTETLGDNFNSTEKKLKKSDTIDNSLPNNPISKIYLKMNRGKNGRKGSEKKLKNERLEKFKFLYNDNNLNEKYLFNRSLDNVRTLNLENNQNKSNPRINSSIPGMRSKKSKGKNKVENYTSRDLYDTGLFVNFNSKNEEDNYINNLKNNALCVKLLEKGIKLDQVYLNDYINKSSNFSGDYFYSSKSIPKEKYNNSKQFAKEKNYFNMSFNKKVNTNFEENKYHEYLQKGENDNAFVIKENQDRFIYRNPQNKIKIKNLSAIE